MRVLQSLCSMLKLIFSLASVAVKRRTGIDTRPNEIWADANARGISSPYFNRCTPNCALGDDDISENLCGGAPHSPRAGGDVRADCRACRPRGACAPGRLCAA